MKPSEIAIAFGAILLCSLFLCLACKRSGPKLGNQETFDACRDAGYCDNGFSAEKNK